MKKFLLSWCCLIVSALYGSLSQDEAFNLEASQQLWEICRNPCVEEENTVGKELEKRFGEKYDIHQEKAIITQEIFGEHKDFLSNNPLIIYLKRPKTNTFEIILWRNRHINSPSIEKVIPLLEAKADPNYSNNQTTPLCMLSKKEHLSTNLIQLFINNKAIVDQPAEFFQNVIKNENDQKNNSEQLIQLFDIVSKLSIEIPKEIFHWLAFYNPSSYVAAKLLQQLHSENELLVMQQCTAEELLDSLSLRKIGMAKHPERPVTLRLKTVFIIKISMKKLNFIVILKDF